MCFPVYHKFITSESIKYSSFILFYQQKRIKDSPIDPNVESLFDPHTKDTETLEGAIEFTMLKLKIYLMMAMLAPDNSSIKSHRSTISVLF